MPGTDPAPYQPTRRHRRVAWRGVIALTAPSWPDIADAVVRDVSYGGIALEIERPVHRGDRFTFALESNGAARTIVGEVRYTADAGGLRYRVGLRWLDLTPEDVKAVEAFVDNIV
jgi:hypothetical protein